jgi:hypothetical protein
VGNKQRQREKRITLKKQLTTLLTEVKCKELGGLAKAKSIQEGKRQQGNVSKVFAISNKGTRNHLLEGDLVSILPIFGKLFLETVKAVWEKKKYELIYYGDGENFGITQKRFGRFIEVNASRGKELSTRACEWATGWSLPAHHWLRRL